MMPDTLPGEGDRSDEDEVLSSLRCEVTWCLLGRW
jgi:hypothetical protein